MRTISPATLRDMLAQEADRVILICLTISHVTLTPSIRVVNNMKDVTFNGETFIGFPFDITLASESEETISDVELKIDNIDRRLVESIRGIQTPPDILLQVISVAPDGTVTQELGDMHFIIQDVNADVLTISATLGFEADYLNEPAVKDRFDPPTAPGLF